MYIPRITIYGTSGCFASKRTTLFFTFRLREGCLTRRWSWPGHGRIRRLPGDRPGWGLLHVIHRDKPRGGREDPTHRACDLK